MSQAAKDFLKSGVRFTVCKKCGHIIGYMPDEKIDKCLNPKCNASLCVENTGGKK
jgi:predicted peroxiredoxin